MQRAVEEILRRFQFTPLREGRPQADCIRQFTPLREGRPGIVTLRGITNDFNSRPSARGDEWVLVQVEINIHFNSRPSARGDVKSPPLASCLTYFNSRPSARGDLRFEEPGDGRGISIHAPPRGATSRQRMYWRRLSISIHAPPRGATGCKQGLISLYERISIHAPPRGATSRKLWLLKVQKISIHAPPRGATNPRAEKKGVSPYFNSRPSARGDKRCLLAIE